MQSNDTVRDRDGHVLGPKAKATRARLLEVLRTQIEHGPGWRELSLVQLAREAGISAASFYLHFESARQALFELTRRELAAGAEFTPRLLAVLDLLTAEGWSEARRLRERINARAAKATAVNAATPPAPARSAGTQDADDRREECADLEARA